MDKSWINQRRLHPEYIQGVKEFIKLACENNPLSNEVTCPCKLCRNVRLVKKNLLGEHLMINGFLPSYTSWIFHEEDLLSSVPHNEDIGPSESSDGDEVYEMLYEGFGIPPPNLVHPTSNETESSSSKRMVQRVKAASSAEHMKVFGCGVIVNFDVIVNFEKRLRKNPLEKESVENGLEVDCVDALPLKTLDGKLFYRTVPKISQHSDNATSGDQAIGDNEADGGDKSLLKLTKPV